MLYLYNCPSLLTKTRLYSNLIHFTLNFANLHKIYNLSLIKIGNPKFVISVIEEALTGL
jgi:hypothetical protein